MLGGPAELDSEDLLVLGSDMTFGFHALGYDRSPPTSFQTLAGDLGENNWYRSGVSVTLSASDTRSGVASIGYRLDGADWLNYAAPVLVEGDGVHAFEFFAMDYADLSEVPRSSLIQIDTTPPSHRGSLPGRCRDALRSSCLLDRARRHIRAPPIRGPCEWGTAARCGPSEFDLPRSPRRGP